MTTGQRESTRLDHQARILRLLVHLQEHLDDAVSLESLAKVACMSPLYFHRVFRGMLGETVMEHVRRLRIERAAHRLRHGQNAVVRLAFDAGYESHEAFTRAFSRHFGVPPSRYRVLHQKVTWPRSPNGVHFSEQGVLDRFEPVASGADDMDVRIEKRQRTRVAFVRNVGPYQGSKQAWETLMAWVRKRGMFGPSTQMPSRRTRGRMRISARPTGLFSGSGSRTMATGPPTRRRSNATSTIPGSRPRRTSEPRSGFGSSGADSGSSLVSPPATTLG